MAIEFSETQKTRLQELGVSSYNKIYNNEKERNKEYQKIEKIAIESNKKRINDLLKTEHQTQLCRLEYDLAKVLCENGFTQVCTPTIISKGFLKKMTIDENSALFEQVFWLDNKSCLRPMLAPNLYEVSGKLLRIKKDSKPLRLFEIGSCFRKESEGKNHLKEFTMLNLVEWGTNEDDKINNLKEFAKIVLETAGIYEYKLIQDESVVYGKGLDVVGSNDLELASTSMGPHKLDIAWNINSNWVGIGFGLERLLMYREKSLSINKYAKSTTFLNGATLNIK